MIEVQEFRAEVRDWLAANLVGEFAALKGLGAPGREEKEAEYLERGDPKDGQGAIRAQHTLLELVSYSPGR